MDGKRLPHHKMPMIYSTRFERDIPVLLKGDHAPQRGVARASGIRFVKQVDIPAMQYTAW